MIILPHETLLALSEHASAHAFRNVYAADVGRSAVTCGVHFHPACLLDKYEHAGYFSPENRPGNGRSRCVTDGGRDERKMLHVHAGDNGSDPRYGRSTQVPPVLARDECGLNNCRKHRNLRCIVY